MFYSEETIMIFESTFPAIRHTRVSTEKTEGQILESHKQEDHRLCGHVYFTAHLYVAFIN